MNDLPEYTKIDMETWPRREHYLYYRNQLPCAYSVTAAVDVTDLLDFSRKKQMHFAGCFLYTVSRTVNEMDCMRMMTGKDHEPGIWNVSNPVFTVFHKDDETFSDLWMNYKPNLPSFHQEYVSVIDQYANNKGIKGRPGQPANFFCFSMVPWLNFTGYSTWTAGASEPNLFPIITCGKYHEENGRILIPVSMTIGHAAADGYGTAVFFRKLQENINAVRL